MKKVEALFESARADTLSREDVERLWRSVAAGGGAGGLGLGGNGGLGGPGAALKGSGLLLKVGLGVAAAGGIAAAIAFGRAGAPAESASPVVPIAAPAGGRMAPSAQLGRSVSETSPGAAPSVAWEDLPRANGEGEASPKAARPARPPAAAVSPSSAAPAPVAAPGIAGGPASAPVEGSGDPAAPSEGALLLQARRQLASNPGGTLALAGEAARRFPGGPLAPEREVLAIEALARLGRAAEARERLAAFRAQYPQSPHLARLAALVGP